MKIKMPLFGKATKSPVELVRVLKDSLLVLEKGGDGKKQEKAQEDVSKHLTSITVILSGSDSEQQSDILLAQLSQEMYNSGLLPLLLNNMNRIDFEVRKRVIYVQGVPPKNSKDLKRLNLWSFFLGNPVHINRNSLLQNFLQLWLFNIVLFQGKKDAAQIFNNVLRRQIGTRTPTVEYICTTPEIVFTLCRGYEHQEIALNCGTMLKECIRYEALAKIILYSDHFYDFFKYVEVSTFDIASDAFTTFKELLTRHKMLAAEFLEQNYDKVFLHYQQLLHSDNYVTKRQSLKLLGELLLDRHNFSVMTKYISNPDNLKLMMNMLKHKSKNIQFEAFHVFKVFVANPNKPKPILDILLRNQDKLVEFLSKFHTDRTEDEQFNDEKAYLIKQIKELKALPETSS